MTPAERPRLLPWAGWAMLVAALVLAALGVLGIYAGEAESETGPANTLRQIARLAAGLIGFVVAFSIGFRRIGRWSYVLYGLVLALLGLLLIAKFVPMEPFIRAKRNAYRWIEWGPLRIQVSDLAKIALVLALAQYLRFRSSHRLLRGLFVPILMAAVPAGLIVLEPDLGTALLFPPTLLVMLYAAGARLRHLALLVAVGLVTAPFYYYSPFISDYQRNRIEVIFRQNLPDARWQMAEGYQLRQSKIALGSGRAVGQGFKEAAFFRHRLLPEDHNDFIFAVLAHQWGFVGAVGVLACYLVIVGACLTAASATRDPFGRLVAVGVAALIGAQTFVNVGMTMGIMPITGMSLPFVSFGGSGLFTHFIAIGLAASVARREPVSIAPRAFEFDDEQTP